MTMRPGRRRFEPALIGVGLLLPLFIGWLARTVWQLPLLRPGLEGVVAARLGESGVASPVTAVLLNFRGYDTLLEVMVLFLAVLGVWSLAPAVLPTPRPTSPVQVSAVRLLVPLMLLVAVYLVWEGSRLAGGAFQGGAVLAAAGVMLLVANLPWLVRVEVVLLRLGLVLGPAVFVAVAAGCLLGGGRLLEYPTRWAGELLLAIEFCCALSIGLTLAALFAGGRPQDDVPPAEGSSGEGS